MVSHQVDMTVIAPDDVREYGVVKEEDETDKHYEARCDLISAILDQGGF